MQLQRTMGQCRPMRMLVALLLSAATMIGLAAPGKADPTGDDAAFLAALEPSEPAGCPAREQPLGRRLPSRFGVGGL